ncbi:MAG: trypsin-like peptidase domain-containing protein, partial [Syntrophales bacterium LBB04]|nr:trypsin-like peptidase domain-containing protein [Syntrophales bacterium LBB04]
KALQSSYHGIIETVRPAVISIDTVVQDPNNPNPGEPNPNYNRIGSGVIIDPRGYCLSSLHVVAGSTNMKATVYSQGGAAEYPLKIVKADPLSDLVLLRIQGDGPFPQANLGDSNAVRTGDVVLSLGSPFGFEQSVTSGIVSARNRTINVGGKIYEGLIQTDSSINKGSSGGPLLNAKGEVIGINTAIYSPSGVFSGISFTVPINKSLDLIGGVLDFKNEQPPVAGGQLAAWRINARQIGNSYRLPDGQIITPPHQYRGVCCDCHPQLRSQGFMPNNPVPGRGLQPKTWWGARRNPANLGPGPLVNPVWGARRNPGPWCPVVGPSNISLGITVIDVDDITASQNRMMRPAGVLVNTVTPGMAGDAAGLQRGDVICRIDGRKIKDSKDFKKFLETKSGAGIDLVILRQGTRKMVTVKTAPGGTAQTVAGIPTVPIRQPTEFAWLGGELTPGPPDKKGVLVAETGGVLATNGVMSGDIIKAVNNNPVTDMNAFIKLSLKADVKKGILLDIIRFGDPMFITVKG